MTTLRIEHSISDFNTWYGAFGRFESLKPRFGLIRPTHPRSKALPKHASQTRRRPTVIDCRRSLQRSQGDERDWAQKFGGDGGI